MKLLPLASAGSILAGIAYFSWAPPEQGKASVAASADRPAVPFVIKAKVKVIWEQHLKLIAATSRGDANPAKTRIRLAADDIKERLIADGIHTQEDILAVVRAAAHEAGLNEGQTAAVVTAFQSVGRRTEGGDGGLIGSLRESMVGIGGSPPEDEEQN